jgi:hypothetical protein
MTIDAIEATPEAYVPPTNLEADENFVRQLDAAYGLSPEQFLALKTADRDLAVFLLVREMAGTLRTIELRLNEYEEKGKALATPEGMQKLMDGFLGGGGLGMGSLMGGLLR